MANKSKKNKDNAPANAPLPEAENAAPDAPPAEDVFADASATPEAGAEASAPAATVPADTPAAPAASEETAADTAHVTPPAATNKGKGKSGLTGKPPVTEDPKQEVEPDPEASEELRPPPLWPNFNAPPEDYNAKALKAALEKRAEEEKAALIPAKGHSKYLCLRNNGSGKYRKGKVYTLPDGQHKDLFQKI